MSTDYPPDWDQRRRDVYAEDDYQCQNCGREGGPNGSTELHAHHIVPKSRGGTHAKSNLVTVCKECHAAVHGDTVAPTAQHRDVERWTEITGSVIDDSKQLVVDVDEHMGRVSDHLSETTHDGEYTLLDRNPADNDNLWNEQDDLRHRFYAIKALLDERKQYQNDVTPATVKRAVSQYFSSVQAYVKATIDIWSFFEEVSRDGPFSVLHCPACEEDLERDSEFCRHCGAEIDFSDHEAGDQAEQVGQRWDQLHKAFNEAADDMQIDMVEMDIAMNEASPNDTAVEWEHCPNCGFENSVWVDMPREATCRFCQAHWTKRGILFTKWEMVDGNYVGEALADDEWEQRGRTKHEDRDFEDRLRTHH